MRINTPVRNDRFLKNFDEICETSRKFDDGECATAMVHCDALPTIPPDRLPHFNAKAMRWIDDNSCFGIVRQPGS
jgi:hypothetical protein